MKQFLSKIWYSPSARNVGKLLSANVLAQAIGLLIYPLLTRLYSPEDFGLLNLFLSIGGVLAILFTAQFQHAIPVAEKDQEAKGVFHAGLLCLIGGSILICLLPFLAAPFSRLFDAPDLANYVWLLPVYVFAIGLWQLLNNWYIRQKAFGHISTYLLSQNILSAGGKVGMGYGRISGGLVYGSVCAVILACIGSIIAGWKRQLNRLWPCGKADLVNAFHRFKNYPLYATPGALVNAVNCNIAVWLLTPIFGLQVTGYFGMAMLLGYTPISLITDSMFQVLFQKVSERVNAKRPIGNLFGEYAKKFTLVVLPFFTILYFAMPWLVKVLLGDGWEETTRMLRCFLPWFALFCFSLPWSFIPLLFEKQRINLWFEIILFALRLGIFAIAGYTHNLTYTIITYSAVGSVILVAQLVWYRRLLSHHDQSCQIVEP